VNLFNYDSHIHTELCGHALGMTVDKLIAHADRIGLQTIAVTDHIVSPEHRKNIDRIRTRVENTEHNCRIIIGAEIDADYHHYDGKLVTDELDGIDYVIGAIHFLPGFDILPHCQEQRPLSDDETLCRWRQMLLGLVANPSIDTLAHPGAMIANALSADGFRDAVLEVFCQAARISAENDIAWEINNLIGSKLTSSLRGQYHKIMQIALDAGLRLIYASDAHCPEEIAGTGFVSEVLAKITSPKRIEQSLESARTT